MNKLLLIFLLVVIGFANSLQSQEAQDQVLLDSAKSHYDRGEYQQAAALYLGFVESGIVSEAIYYNLGNCFFKLGDKAKAVLYYEKTLKLNGGNENAEHNLLVVNKTLVDKFEKIPSFSMKPLFKGVNSVVSFDLLGMLSIVCLVIALLLFYRMKSNGKAITFMNSWIVLVIALVIYLWGAVQKNQVINVTSGVVSSNGVEIHSEPNISSTLLFELNEGAKVEFIDKNEDWLNIKTKDGNQGWVKSILILTI